MASVKENKDPIEVLERFFEEGLHCSMFHRMPAFIKQRANALKNLQIDHIKLENEFHKEVLDLEIKYQAKHEEFYRKRYEIVSGKYEPTEKEAQLPENVIDYNEQSEDIENEAEIEKCLPEQFQLTQLSEKEQEEAKNKIKGIPGFWLGAMLGCGDLVESIEVKDREILKYLSDIRVEQTRTGFSLQFVFEPNPYFTNEILTKKYTILYEPDQADPFSYDGPCVTKSEGCTIDWKDASKDPTKKMVVKRMRHKTKGTTKEIKKQIYQQSFFHFFNPPQLPENREELDEATSESASVDFEMGEIIRTSLIPNATLYCTGYPTADDEDEDDLDDEEDDDDEDMDDDDDDDSLDGDTDGN